MYTKSKNSLLFVIFILIILIIVSILIVAVYNTKQNNLEQYKVSLNNVLYDDDYNFVSLKDDAILKKEWDDKFYLYSKDDIKYSLGSESVLYDKATRQVTIYGDVYQIFSNGDVSKIENKTVISKLDEFQFFKLNDRKYLIIGDKILGPGITTIDYLIVSIDRAGNAALLNHSVNIKTINPLTLNIGDRIFDVANEKLIIGEEKIDLKKINGSTNEYVEGSNQIGNFTGVGGSTGGGSGGSGGSGGFTGNSGSSGAQEFVDYNSNIIWENIQGLINNSSGNSSSNNKVYKEIANQIITLSGLISTNTNKNSLYKNVSLRDVIIESGYIDIFYSIIDPENKYLSVYLAIQKITSKDEEAEDLAEKAVSCDNPNVECVFLNKDASHYRKLGLSPSNEYMISLNYLESGKSLPSVADVITVVTSKNPTSVKIIEQDLNTYTYNIKLHNEYAFNKARVVITDCNGNNLTKNDEYISLDIQNALTENGAIGKITRMIDAYNQPEFICLQLIDVQDASGNTIAVDSYHKIKVKN